MQVLRWGDGLRQCYSSDFDKLLCRFRCEMKTSYGNVMAKESTDAFLWQTNARTAENAINGTDCVSERFPSQLRAKEAHRTRARPAIRRRSSQSPRIRPPSARGDTSKCSGAQRRSAGISRR